MAAQNPPDDKSRLQEELGPELREAIESILHDDPPADWSEEVLDRLRQRSLRTAPRSPRRLVTWIALAAAACLLAFMVRSFSGVNDDGSQQAKDVQERLDVRAPEEIQVVVSDHLSTPTLLTYQLAARRSPETLDALLDHHAVQLLRPAPETALADVMRELL